MLDIDGSGIESVIVKKKKFRFLQMEGVTSMNNLVPINNMGISNLGTSGTAFVSELLAAVPTAIASPILAYQRTKEQSKLIEISMQIRKQERADIMKTMRVLAAHGQLTPELYQLLMVAYGIPANSF